LAVFCFHLDDKAYAYGILGVPLFFVLSGFLITRLLLLHETDSLGHDLWIFYARRTLRIFPLYYAILVVLLLLGKLPRPLWYFLYLENVDVFFTNAWPGRTAHFWSLCVEEQFYLLFPVALYLWPRKNRVAFLSVLLVGSWLFRFVMDTAAAAQPEVEWRSALLLPYTGEYILWGCLAGWIDLRRENHAEPALALLLTGLVLHTIAALDQFRFQQLAMIGAGSVYQTVHGVGFALVVYGLWRLPSGWARRVFSLGPLVYLGKISYGLYIFHNFMYDLKPVLLPTIPLLRFVPGVLVALIATILMAMISWHCFEKPFLAMKKYFPYARPEGSQPSAGQGDTV